MFWAVSCALVLYVQYMAVLSIVFQICFALVFLRRQRFKVLAYGAWGSLFIVPWFLAAMGQVVSNGADPLTHISWMERPTPTDFVWFFVSIFGSAKIAGALADCLR